MRVCEWVARLNFRCFFQFYSFGCWLTRWCVLGVNLHFLNICLIFLSSRAIVLWMNSAWPRSFTPAFDRGSRNLIYLWVETSCLFMFSIYDEIIFHPAFFVRGVCSASFTHPDFVYGTVFAHLRLSCDGICILNFFLQIRQTFLLFLLLLVFCRHLLVEWNFQCESSKQRHFWWFCLVPWKTGRSLSIQFVFANKWDRQLSQDIKAKM